MVEIDHLSGKSSASTRAFFVADVSAGKQTDPPRAYIRPKADFFATLFYNIFACRAELKTANSRQNIVFYIGKKSPYFLVLCGRIPPICADGG